MSIPHTGQVSLGINVSFTLDGIVPFVACIADFELTMVGLALVEVKSRWPIKLGILDGGAPIKDGGELEAEVMMSNVFWLMLPSLPSNPVTIFTVLTTLLFAVVLLFLALRFLVEGVAATIPSSTALTTIPPEDPPQEARDPIGVKLARSFRSIITGCPFSILIFCPM